jgi:HAD superfamily hydrolase (TIGR01509 family)
MILALDFDGVICDSIVECLDTSYRALRLVDHTSALPEQPTLDWRDRFFERRGVVRPSGHYFLLWQWIIRFPERKLSADAFEALAVPHAAAVATFEQTFHRLREEGQAEDPRAFVEANPLFPGVQESWSQLPSPRYIVTTKDDASVRLILDAHTMTVDGVFGRGSGSKPSTLRALAARHGISPHDVVFVDDNALHVAEAAAVGVTAVLAEWGYGPRLPAPAMSLAAFAALVDVFRVRSVS